MLSKNNLKEMNRKQTPKKQRFAIKKLTIGVASVLIGFTFMGVNAQVKADVNNEQSETVQASGNNQPDKNANTNTSSAADTSTTTSSTATPDTNSNAPAPTVKNDSTVSSGSTTNQNSTAATSSDATNSSHATSTVNDESTINFSGFTDVTSVKNKNIKDGDTAKIVYYIQSYGGNPVSNSDINFQGQSKVFLIVPKGFTTTKNNFTLTYGNSSHFHYLISDPLTSANGEQVFELTMDETPSYSTPLKVTATITANGNLVQQYNSPLIIPIDGFNKDGADKNYTIDGKTWSYKSNNGYFGDAEKYNPGAPSTYNSFVYVLGTPTDVTVPTWTGTTYWTPSTQDYTGNNLNTTVKYVFSSTGGVLIDNDYYGKSSYLIRVPKGFKATSSSFTPSSTDRATALGYHIEYLGTDADGAEIFEVTMDKTPSGNFSITGNFTADSQQPGQYSYSQYKPLLMPLSKESNGNLTYDINSNKNGYGSGPGTIVIGSQTYHYVTDNNSFNNRQWVTLSYTVGNVKVATPNWNGFAQWTPAAKYTEANKNSTITYIIRADNGTLANGFHNLYRSGSQYLIMIPAGFSATKSDITFSVENGDYKLTDLVNSGSVTDSNHLKFLGNYGPHGEQVYLLTLDKTPAVPGSTGYTGTAGLHVNVNITADPLNKAGEYSYSTKDNSTPLLMPIYSTSGNTRMKETLDSAYYGGTGTVTINGTTYTYARNGYGEYNDSVGATLTYVVGNPHITIKNPDFTGYTAWAPNSSTKPYENNATEHITYIIQGNDGTSVNGDSTMFRSGSKYLLLIPAGFKTNSEPTVSSANSASTGYTIKKLNTTGPHGEQVYEVNLTHTPNYQNPLIIQVSVTADSSNGGEHTYSADNPLLMPIAGISDKDATGTITLKDGTTYTFAKTAVRGAFDTNVNGGNESQNATNNISYIINVGTQALNSSQYKLAGNPQGKTVDTLQIDDNSGYEQLYIPGINSTGVIKDGSYIDFHWGVPYTDANGQQQFKLYDSVLSPTVPVMLKDHPNEQIGTLYNMGTYYRLVFNQNAENETKSGKLLNIVNPFNLNWTISYQDANGTDKDGNNNNDVQLETDFGHKGSVASGLFRVYQYTDDQSKNGTEDHITIQNDVEIGGRRYTSNLPVIRQWVYNGTAVEATSPKFVAGSGPSIARIWYGSTASGNYTEAPAWYQNLNVKFGSDMGDSFDVVMDVPIFDHLKITPVAKAEIIKKIEKAEAQNQINKLSTKLSNGNSSLYLRNDPSYSDNIITPTVSDPTVKEVDHANGLGNTTKYQEYTWHITFPTGSHVQFKRDNTVNFMTATSDVFLRKPDNIKSFAVDRDEVYQDGSYNGIRSANDDTDIKDESGAVTHHATGLNLIDDVLSKAGNFYVTVTNKTNTYSAFNGWQAELRNLPNGIAQNHIAANTTEAGKWGLTAGNIWVWQGVNDLNTLINNGIKIEQNEQAYRKLPNEVRREYLKELLIGDRNPKDPESHQSIFRKFQLVKVPDFNAVGFTQGNQLLVEYEDGSSQIVDLGVLVLANPTIIPYAMKKGADPATVTADNVISAQDRQDGVGYINGLTWVSKPDNSRTKFQYGKAKLSFNMPAGETFNGIQPGAHDFVIPIFFTDNDDYKIINGDNGTVVAKVDPETKKTTNLMVISKQTGKVSTYNLNNVGLLQANDGTIFGQSAVKQALVLNNLSAKLSQKQFNQLIDSSNLAGLHYTIDWQPTTTPQLTHQALQGQVQVKLADDVSFNVPVNAAVTLSDTGSSSSETANTQWASSASSQYDKQPLEVPSDFASTVNGYRPGTASPAKVVDMANEGIKANTTDNGASGLANATMGISVAGDGKTIIAAKPIVPVKYTDNAADEAEHVDLQHLTTAQQQEISTFTAGVINQIRQQVQSQPDGKKISAGYVHTSPFADQLAKEIVQEAYAHWPKNGGHNGSGVIAAAKERGLKSWVNENLGTGIIIDNLYSDLRNNSQYIVPDNVAQLNMNDVKKSIYQMILSMLFQDNGANPGVQPNTPGLGGHSTALLNDPQYNSMTPEGGNSIAVTPAGKLLATQYVGSMIDKNGAYHIVFMSDDNASDKIKSELAENAIVPGVYTSTSADPNTPGSTTTTPGTHSGTSSSSTQPSATLAQQYGSSVVIKKIVITVGDHVGEPVIANGVLIVPTANGMMMLNLEDLPKIPAGTTARWTNEAQVLRDAQTVGNYTEAVTLIFPDGSTSDTHGDLTVLARTAGQPASQPGSGASRPATSGSSAATQPGESQAPSESQEPGAAQHGTNSSTQAVMSHSGNLVTEAPTSANGGFAEMNSHDAKQKDKLPQTGHSNAAATIGFGFASLLSAFGLAKLNKRKHD